MGKSLRGKECGKGICQRKDGLYSARFVSSEGKRQVKCFSLLPEARNWLDDAKYADKHENIFVSPDMTVDVWFEFWVAHIVGDLAPNTRRNYRERYEYNVKPLIGGMQLADVKPMHCKMVFNRMEASYVGSTIRQTYIAMGTMFRAAVMNDMIQKHPMDGVRFTKPVRAVDDIKCLTTDEQQKFMEAAKRSHNFRSERNLNCSTPRWNTWIGAREKLRACVCVILFLSTGVQENRQRTVPMIPTFTNCAMRQESGDSVCTLCATPMQRVQSKAGCSQKCCKNCSVMPASKRRWIATFM